MIIVIDEKQINTKKRDLELELIELDDTILANTIKENYKLILLRKSGKYKILKSVLTDQSKILSSLEASKLVMMYLKR